ncbi:glucosaminidase domain-containing protein [Cohnella sp. JJ-181]|uniref:glucosaminidase domain-containing protein n=1 Tax=Cohnella rhizoplanae TaxID=2974897 RepID=UPI0022FFC364|nr:glucosaminidase domain-containing protein [Cohnella sp. JJ-181]CAI6031493.1 hypothetical protein COHCIP112018_00719 [Cohnella sp. JJ-181]
MRGDKKRYPLVVLLVATLFATLGLTSLASLQDAVPAAIAAPALSPLPAPAPADVPRPQSGAAIPLRLPDPIPAPAPADDAFPLAYEDGPSSVNPNDLPPDNRKKPLKFTLDEELRASGNGSLANNGEPDGTPEAAPKPPAVAPYIVTAYYLNVRANPYNGSKVLRVVKQGTQLEVLSRTDKGWLRLKDGGYVHGGYAEPAGEAASGSATGAKAETQPLPEPASEGKPPSSAAREGAVQAADPKPEWTPQEASPDEDADPARPTNRVRSDSGLTEAHIAKLFKDTALAGHGIEDVVLEIEEKYGINAFFTIAVMKLESGNGKSKLSRTKNNLFGLNATSGTAKAFSFKTKADSVRKFGQLLSDKYVDKGLTTVDKVAAKYCPASSSWAGKVMGIMKSDFRKL